MPELFIELFSEEIPARMQARAAADLERLVGEALSPIHPNLFATFYGPRRIALSAAVAAETPAARATERGPRANAPEQALAGFLRKHAAARERLRVEGDFYVLDRSSEAVPAATLVAAELPALLRRFPWPKSMRWGGASAFAWVRPLRRIVCLLDGRVVPFDLRDGDDDGHGLASSNLTEGHRFHAPGAFAVEGRDDWEQKLRDRFVVVRAEDRRAMIADGMARLAAAQGLTVADDPGLLDEVAGLVEWPVPLLGRIGAEFMDLPPEVMQVSMRVHQRYFALRTPDGSAAPWFAFAANIEADDAGAAIVAGNERVLRARFSDARHFWDLDRRTKLVDRVPALANITFHAKLGTQAQRVDRLVRLASVIAPLVDADPALAERAALLAKADLTTGMVGEFPELQGVMGRYYALHHGEPAEVADAIRDHHSPKGMQDLVPTSPTSVAVALADRIDSLVCLMIAEGKPSGSGDPYALRRAALGVIRIVLINKLRINIFKLIEQYLFFILGKEKFEELYAAQSLTKYTDVKFESRVVADFFSVGRNVPVINVLSSVFDFILERFRVFLRSSGVKYDILSTQINNKSSVWNLGELSTLDDRTLILSQFFDSHDGELFLKQVRRLLNILRLEERKDGPFAARSEITSQTDSERALEHYILNEPAYELISYNRKNANNAIVPALNRLSPLLQDLFDNVTINDPDPDIRFHRLSLLTRVRERLSIIADFSRVEG